MKYEDYREAIQETFRMCEEVLVQKHAEYSSTYSPFHNFCAAGEIIGESPFKALEGMMVKHTVSVYDMLKEPYLYPMSKWDEKIIDHINYLAILRAMLIDAQITSEGIECVK